MTKAKITYKAEPSILKFDIAVLIVVSLIIIIIGIADIKVMITVLLMLFIILNDYG